ncbi:hypothetical protein XBI1_1170003 [Xenorhabdus bovienii str. Intermedium]|uniref:Uncharacterized protein n=1 Tax=Xenorhabdus bovienii str. Intermedium TaxID=1379677 RepID=A0A077Q446_XENBV|nr:hypothetical protein XBI1_1170003 [Xenorhabdus bovienii str. Intermedium]
MASFDVLAQKAHSNAMQYTTTNFIHLFVSQLLSVVDSFSVFVFP